MGLVSDEISGCGIENLRLQGCFAMYMGTYVSLPCLYSLSGRGLILLII
jgi:hypothetical protein